MKANFFFQLLAANMILALFETYAQQQGFVKLVEFQYGGDYQDQNQFRQSMLLHSDSCLYVFGFTRSYLGGNKSDPNCLGNEGILYPDGWLNKIDANGSKKWDRTYGGKLDDGTNYCISSLSGNLLLMGSSVSDISCEKSQNNYGSSGTSDIWIVELDTAGNILWDKRYGWDNDDVLTDVIQFPDKSYLIGGWTWSSTGGDISDTSHGMADFWLLKIDSAGNKQWDNLIGSHSHDVLFSMAKLSSDEILLCGETASDGPNGDLAFPNWVGPGSWDGWAIKIDTSGQIVWQGLYGSLDDDGIVHAVENSKHELIFLSFLLPGSVGGDVTDSVERGGMDMWIFAIDSSGNMITDKRIGGDANDQPQSMMMTSDGGYLIKARSNSNQGFEKSENSKGGYDFWLIKLDSALNIQWDKTIGGPDDEWSPTVIFLNDSVFWLSGQSDSDIGGDKGLASFDTTTNPTYQKSDMWLTKWMITTPAGVEESNASSSFTLYPNPANDFIYIRNHAQRIEKDNLIIRDISGREVMKGQVRGSTSTHRINIALLDKGIYFMEWDGKVKRFMKM